MSVNPDSKTEYERRHNPIWLELEQTLRQHGAHNYSIFIDEKTNQLFAYVEIEDIARWNAIAETECCRQWSKYMMDIMPTHSDNRPISTDLREVFHMI